VLSQGSYGLFRAVLVTDSMTSGHTIQDDMILVQQHLLFTYNINSTQILPEHFCGPDETLLGDDIVSEQTLGELFVEPTLIPENNISEGVLSTTSLIQQHLLVNDQLNSGQILNELFVEPILITEDNTSEQSLDELFIEPNLLVDDIESEQSIAETTLEL
jgi:hypothetical protein